MAGDGLLSARGLEVRGLEPVDLWVGAGELVAVRGPSGSGKSLLLRALADLDPVVGTVQLGGVDRRSDSGARWRQQVGLVPAEPAYWGDTVAEHFQDWSALGVHRQALGLSEAFGPRLVRELSSGEKQRLALLRALEREPRVLLLDEPTRALDPAATAAVERLVHAWCGAARAVLWVTHDPPQAARIARRALTLREGRVVSESLAPSAPEERG